MRIGIFSGSFEPVTNGVSVSIATLRKLLEQRGHEVFVFAPAYKGYEDSSPNIFRLPSWHTPFARDYPIALPWAPRAKAEFRRLDVDIVHTHTPFVVGVLGLRWARWLGKPVVTTNHTLYTEYSHYIPIVPQPLVKKIIVRHLRWYYDQCDAVAVPSTPVADLLRSYGVKRPIEVIQTGVDQIALSQDGHRRDIRAKWGIPQDARLIIYAGRLAREKNLGLLFSAFAELSPKFPDARLMLVGGGPAARECKAEIARLGLTEKVVFTGFRPRTEIQPICQAGEVFAFPSRTDTQAVVVCEALCAGLPCVAVRDGGTPEVIRDGVDGFLTSNSREEFTARLGQLMANQDLRQGMSAEALSGASRFSEAGMVESFIGLYERTMERS